jgi:Na+/proline symporter
MIIIGLGVLLAAVFGDWAKVKDALAAMDPARLSFIGPGESMLERLDRWMVPILGSLVTQETLARVLAARTPSIARRASYLAAGLYFLVGVIPVFLGLVGPTLLPGVADQEQFLIHLAGGLLPRLLFILFAGALISASLSTTDSILLAISALLNHNLVFPIFRVQRERTRVLLARFGVMAAGAAACVIAIMGGGIYNLVVTASAFGTAGVLVITLAGLHSRAGGEKAALGALGMGLLATLLGQYVLGLPAPFLTAVLASAAVFGAGAVLKW